MGSFSVWHWVLVIIVALILFGGGGKISGILGDFGKGIKAFKKGLKEEDGDESSASRKAIDGDEAAKEKDKASTV